jgi:hypothetical protein
MVCVAVLEADFSHCASRYDDVKARSSAVICQQDARRSERRHITPKFPVIVVPRRVQVPSQFCISIFAPMDYCRDQL